MNGETLASSSERGEKTILRRQSPLIGNHWGISRRSKAYVIVLTRHVEPRGTLERSHSGLVRALGKRVDPKGPRGFESPPLRHVARERRGSATTLGTSPIQSLTMKKIVAVGGGSIRRKGTVAIDREIIRLSGKKKPKLLF